MNYWPTTCGSDDSTAKVLAKWRALEADGIYPSRKLGHGAPYTPGPAPGRWWNEMVIRYYPEPSEREGQ